MKKALIVLGVFLLIQYGVALIMTLIGQAGGIAGLSIDKTGGVSLSSTFQLMLIGIASLCSTIAIIAVCNDGIVKPFRFAMPPLRGLSIIALSALTMIPLGLLISEVSSYFGVPDFFATMFQGMAHNPYAIPILVLIGPLGEELCFRYGIAGNILRGQKKGGSIWIPILISAFLFGLIHFNPAQSLAAFAIGVFFGWLYVRTGSLWPSLVCHMLNNFVSILLLRQGAEASSLRHYISSDVVYIIIVAGLALLVVLLLWATAKTIKRRK